MYLIEVLDSVSPIRFSIHEKRVCPYFQNRLSIGHILFDRGENVLELFDHGHSLLNKFANGIALPVQMLDTFCQNLVDAVQPLLNQWSLNWDHCLQNRIIYVYN